MLMAGSTSSRTTITAIISSDVNHEFMAVAAVGEDDFVWCPACDYAANTEAARRGTGGSASGSSSGADKVAVATPDLASIEEVATFLKVEPSAVLKSLAFVVRRQDDTEETGIAVIAGDLSLIHI